MNKNIATFFVLAAVLAGGTWYFLGDDNTEKYNRGSVNEAVNRFDFPSTTYERNDPPDEERSYAQYGY